MKKGYVYYKLVAKEYLKTILEKLEPQIYFMWTLDKFTVGTMIPETVFDAGSAFNSSMEIKWEKDGQMYHVWILSDKKIEIQGWDEIQGDWKTEEKELKLINLNDKKFSPNFNVYPQIKKSSGRVRARIFYRNAIPVFISLREVIE